VSVHQLHSVVALTKWISTTT